MKKLFLFPVLLLFACNSGQEPQTTDQPNSTPIAQAGFISMPPPDSDRKIQMAILFDASGSMNGLLNQAKSHIWKIVNELSAYQFGGMSPEVQIALYTYGNDGNGMKTGFVKQLAPLTTDLDLISLKLFSITTNGGSEYCGQVLSTSFQELNWSASPEDLKVVYIAGNEPFNQGPINYKSICSRIQQSNIAINTIYCGDYSQGIREFWKDGAQIGGGDYFNINSDHQIIDMVTPYDQDIQVLNDSLNKTYYGYGSLGQSGKSLQFSQDAAAYSMSSANQVERTITKSKALYSNSSWDIVDAVENGDVQLKDLKEEEKPEIIQNLSVEKQEAVIAELKAKRAKYQEQISLLAQKRAVYIEQNQSEDSNQTFSTSLLNSLEKQAIKIGYKKSALVP